MFSSLLKQRISVTDLLRSPSSTCPFWYYPASAVSRACPSQKSATEPIPRALLALLIQAAVTIPRPTTVCTNKNLVNNGINYQPQLVIVGFLVAINRMKRLRLSIPLWMAGFVTASRTSSLLFFGCLTASAVKHFLHVSAIPSIFFQCPPDPWRIQIVPGEAPSYCSQARTSQMFLSDSIVLIPYHVWYSIFTYIYHKN